MYTKCKSEENSSDLDLNRLNQIAIQKIIHLCGLRENSF